MSNLEQRNNLQAQVWKMANEVRGAVDGWDFKHYVLGMLFYRFISESFIKYADNDDPDANFAQLADKDISATNIQQAVEEKGFFIYPSQLFCNVANKANTNDNLNDDLLKIFTSIQDSANGVKKAENAMKGLFSEFDMSSTRLGNSVSDKNKCLRAIIKGVEGLEFDEFGKSDIDIFGDAYEFIISKYAANAGKSGGEFFTPQSVSKLIAKIAIHDQNRINKVYDLTTGSGSLLLQVKRLLGKESKNVGFFGQEINHTTYNLARMNMFLHNVNYDKFNIALGNTLTDPQFKEDKPFDVIVSNPPYSTQWVGADDPVLSNDDRFSPAGTLAPKSKADFAFVLHALHYLSSKGRAAIVCFPGIFYRSGAEQKIRKYLIDNNYVESVISLAPNLFYGTSIAVTILVLSKHKSDTKVQFIDVSSEEFFKKETNNNILTECNIDEILSIFADKKDIDHVCKMVNFEKIAEENYNLSVSSYVEAKNTREVIDIAVLNAEIKNTVAKINVLRDEIDKIVSEIEGC